MRQPDGRAAKMRGGAVRRQLIQAFSTLVALTILLPGLWGCSEGDPPRATANGGPAFLRIVATWPGDDFASKQQLETRDRIGRRISQGGVGRMVRSGTGMGWMDIVVAVEDSDRARVEIEKIIGEIAPGPGFSIQAAGP